MIRSDTVERTMKKRLKALEARSSQEGLLLTEAQLAALEKAKEQREAKRKIESEHPGYLGSQDTYDVGTMKGVGCFYQQTFVDTYPRVALEGLETHAIVHRHEASGYRLAF